ncbi:Leucine Rich repeats (2 copies) [Alienimonas californiensis]|uniref:Leucine Rich repeats (2 copies) n=1 Tax=Alienimonas californiensis TaxID=2527989 RepID=A0A517P590_9PLAN|nr:Leucine Rich repeats (2 copies) [Alienimonas californiensis]
MLRRRKGALAFAGLIAGLLGWIAWPHLSAGAAGLLAERRGHYVEWGHYIPEDRRRWAPLPTNAAVWRTPVYIQINCPGYVQHHSSERERDESWPEPEPLSDALDRAERMPHVRSVDLNDVSVSVADARRLVAIEDDVSVGYWNCAFAPGALDVLAARGGYLVVGLQGCSIPPGGLAGFAKVPALLSLSVGGAEGVAGQFRPFAGHPGLTSVFADETDFDDDDLASVVACERLQSLTLRGAAVTDAGIRTLPKRPTLRWLSLTDTAVTDETVRRLAERCPNLDHLDLSGTRVTDAALPHLARFTSLTVLNLAGTRVTAAAADPVIDWPALESLTLSEALAPPDFPLRGWDELGDGGASDGGATLWYVEPAE